MTVSTSDTVRRLGRRVVSGKGEACTRHSDRHDASVSRGDGSKSVCQHPPGTHPLAILIDGLSVFFTGAPASGPRFSVSAGITLTIAAWRKSCLQLPTVFNRGAT